MKAILAMILCVVLFGCINDEQIVGNDHDEHGCIGSAGYQWCESTQKCVRGWEEYCEELKDQFRGDENINSFQGCIDAGYPALESYPRQCNTYSGKHFVEEIDCPADAKVCPDGTAVGRIPPDCEFEPCPIIDLVSKGCVDQCGDGKCAQIVCQAEGCPCAESKASCPQDCK